MSPAWVLICGYFPPLLLLLHVQADWLDGKHVVFGHVVEGMERIQWIEANAGSGDGNPAIEVIVKDCGEVKSKST